MTQANSGDYCLLSNEEARDAIKRICQTSKSEEEVRRRIKEDLNYPYETIAITSTSIKSGRSIMIMFIVTVIGPFGGTITV